ncbi:hypothetical protein HYFRA_00000130 [Hymenoscyphus fraxineus]|uniref:Signal recognition particle subunit SRP14 n=1 Tax=Hymenoscyphus fraxineus TaxID=746836 RepID=A0A9N9L6B2_9HELO|nr:hypothetical protein HYFRA_00000130 [Hymenoscyphus fraxineus]
MAKEHLSNDEFFAQLATLFESSTHGSIYLTQKRMTYGTSAEPTPQEATEAQTPFPDQSLASPTSIIVRATNGKSKAARAEGKKIKLSTIVEYDALEGFFTRYAEVCKGKMSGLKKRDRSKAKEKLKAKKKKLGAGGEAKKA